MDYYTEDAGLEIPVDLCMASPFAWQTAIGNADLESMGAKRYFRCSSLNIGLIIISMDTSMDTNI